MKKLLSLALASIILTSTTFATNYPIGTVYTTSEGYDLVRQDNGGWWSSTGQYDFDLIKEVEYGTYTGSSWYNTSESYTTSNPNTSTTVTPSVGTTVTPSIGTTVTPSIGTTVTPSIGTTVTPSVGTTVTPSVGTTVTPSTTTGYHVTQEYTIRQPITEQGFVLNIPSTSTSVTFDNTYSDKTTYTATRIDDGAIINEEHVPVRAYEVDDEVYYSIEDVFYATGLGNVTVYGDKYYIEPATTASFDGQVEGKGWINYDYVPSIKPSNLYKQGATITKAIPIRLNDTLIYATPSSSYKWLYQNVAGYEIDGERYYDITIIMELFDTHVSSLTTDGINRSHTFYMSFPDGILDIKREYDWRYTSSKISRNPNTAHVTTVSDILDRVYKMQRFAAHDDAWAPETTGSSCMGFTTMLQNYLYNHQSSWPTSSTSFNWDDIKPGDIFAYANDVTDGHIVFVLSKDGDTMKVAEGSCNEKVSWTRTIYKSGINTYQSLQRFNIDYTNNGYDPDVRQYTPTSTTPDVTVPEVTTPEANTATTVTASATASKVIFDGKTVNFEAYNIAWNNYFKLRDLAAMADYGMFNVEWDDATNAIHITTNTGYVKVGGEMATPSGASKTATLSTPGLYVDGVQVNATAYNIEYNNFFKLRDIGDLLGWSVDWNETTGDITVNTK